MRKYKLFIGYRLLGEFSGIWEAKNFAAESGDEREFSRSWEKITGTVGTNQKNRTRMETKIKDITGSGNNRYRLKEAVRQCRECLASPYLMPSGHTVGKTMPTCCGNCSPCKGGNGNTAGNGRENTTRKKSDDN